MSRTLLAGALAVLAMVGRAWAGEPSPSEATAAIEIRSAVQRATTYVTKEGLTWKQKQQCASCHHIPYMVWALNEARDHGYPIDDKALDNVMTWALAEKNHEQVFPGLPLDKKHSETDSLGPLLMALAVGASDHRTAAHESARQRLITHAVAPQAADGSWNPNGANGRPPVHSTPDVQTGLMFLAMSDPASGDVDALWQSQRASAIDWLSRNGPADTLQGRIVRLLVNRRLGKPAAESAPLVEWVLAHQNGDGGWSQTSKMKSDAFATGLVLYALSVERTSGAAAYTKGAADRATKYLLESQLADGSWPMTSRRAEPTGPGPAKDLGPIKYVGTAWATIGLARTAPR
jgi:squalene-hopene/tetraprenyl-beta-curcumene cyclase